MTKFDQIDWYALAAAVAALGIRRDVTLHNGSQKTVGYTADDLRQLLERACRLATESQYNGKRGYALAAQGITVEAYTADDGEPWVTIQLQAEIATMKQSEVT